MARSSSVPLSASGRSPRPRIAYLTAGAGGMYCGSCMHDNTLARGLIRHGADVSLIPTYTPIRTDEQSVAIDRVFFGGINVYLQQKWPLFRYLPGFFDRFLDQPWLIRWATSKASSTDARLLGGLTVSMLRGAHGYQRKEVAKLCQWLASHLSPDLCVLTNILIGGCIPDLKAKLGKPVLVTLQGDDIFLESLPEPYREQALAEIRKLEPSIDGYLVASRFYGDHMAAYLGLPREKIHLVPLGLDTADFPAGDAAADIGSPAVRPPTVGYLARLAPEKGLHELVAAFIALRSRPGMETAMLRIAGWLGDHQREYAESQFAKLRAAGLGDAFHYEGSIDRGAKLQFLSQLDVLSVPTTYQEPKGLFVLESLAAGVPVVQPAHGAFPEMLERIGGGRLVRPGDTEQLADALAELLGDAELRKSLGTAGRDFVLRHHNADEMARETLRVLEQFL